MKYILAHNKSIPILHETELGDRIVQYDDNILFLRRNYTYLWTKLDIEAIIRRCKESKDRKNPENIKKLDYNVAILNAMIGFERGQKIEDILDKNEKDTLWLAC